MSVKEKSPAAKFLESNFVSPSRLSSLLSSPNEESLFQRLQRRLRKVVVDDEELYIAEGDTLLDEAQLEVYALQKQVADKAYELAGIADAAGLGNTTLSDEGARSLLGITQGGRIVRWEQGMVLTYCILKQTFATGTANYELVRDNFIQATGDWENTCGVKFEYKPELDDSHFTASDNLGVVFVVREIDAGGNFIASSFFPNDPINRRRVLVDPSYYGSGRFNKVGVFRHELGHVLGFRHEHIRSGAPAACPHENLDFTIDLTQYDPTSVMHYFCGSVGSVDLKISSLDKSGAQKVYGPPLNMVTFIS